MIEHSESIAALAEALAKAQAKIGTVEKNQEADAGSYKYKYADLAAVLENCRPHLTEHGISVIQAPYVDEDGVGLQTMLMHSSGEWLRSRIGHNMALKRWQDLGGALTYLRRYCYSAMIGVASEEDSDGKDTGALKPQRKRREPEPDPEPPAPDWSAKANTIADTIKSAATPAAIEQTLKVYGHDLQWLHDHKPHYYDRLMTVAQERRDALQDVTPIDEGRNG